MRTKEVFKTFPAAILGSAMTVGCVTTPTGVASPNLEFAQPSDIILGNTATGRIVNENGCLRFFSNRVPKVAIFPVGSTLAADAKSIILPSGQGVIRLGKNQTLAYEAPPSLSVRTFRCSGVPILILSVRES